MLTRIHGSHRLAWLAAMTRMARPLARMARPLARMTRMARWVAH